MSSASTEPAGGTATASSDGPLVGLAAGESDALRCAMFFDALREPRRRLEVTERIPAWAARSWSPDGRVLRYANEDAGLGVGDAANGSRA